MTRPIRISKQQVHILRLIRTGSECWADVYSHYSQDFENSKFHHFDQSRRAVLNSGLVVETDALELTEKGKLALELDRRKILKVS